MNNICCVCGNEKRYDVYHRLYRRFDLCNSKKTLKYYYNNKDKILEKKKNYYHKPEEYYSKKNIKRKLKTSDLENQIKQLTTTVSVSLLYHIAYYYIRTYIQVLSYIILHTIVCVLIL